MKNSTLAHLTKAPQTGIATLFSIKPYQDRLLTPGARYWIACVHLVIFVMAASEAIAWGYLGSLFGDGWIGVVAAVTAFAFMFSIIWVIDVSFISLDLSRSFYDRAILQEDVKPWLDRARLGIGLMGRVIIVLVSLSISAPFLSQIVFKQDIDNEIHRRNLGTVSEMQEVLLSRASNEIAAIEAEIANREAELIQETAGRGSSGNYGNGPVTQAIERNIQRLREERNVKATAKQKLEDQLRGMAPAEIADQYNIALVDDGVQAREAILSGLMENPEYRNAKRAVTAFLAFIFAALVLLKLFQPRSVRIYFNEKLQDLYLEYLSGNLNKWIAPDEQTSKDGKARMSPLRFEDWCINTYSSVRHEDTRRRDGRKIYHLYRMKIEQLEEEKESVQQMFAPLEEALQQKQKELHQLEVALLQTQRDVERDARQEEDYAEQVASIDYDLRNNLFRGSDVLLAVTAKKQLEQQRAEGRHDALEHEHKLNVTQHKREAKKQEVKTLKALTEQIQTNLKDIQDKIDNERLIYTNLIVSGHVFDDADKQMPHHLQETESLPEQPHAARSGNEETSPLLDEPVGTAVDVVLPSGNPVEYVDDTLLHHYADQASVADYIVSECTDIDDAEPDDGEVMDDTSNQPYLFNNQEEVYDETDLSQTFEPAHTETYVEDFFPEDGYEGAGYGDNGYEDSDLTDEITDADLIEAFLRERSKDKTVGATRKGGPIRNGFKGRSFGTGV